MNNARTLGLKFCQKLLITFWLMALVMLFIFFLGNRTIKDSAAFIEGTFSHKIRPLATLANLQSDANRIRLQETEIANLNDTWSVSGRVDALMKTCEAFDHTIENLVAESLESAPERARSIENRWNGYRKLLMRSMNKAMSGNMDQAKQVTMYASLPAFRELSRELKALCDEKRKTAQREYLGSRSRLERSRDVFSLISVLGIIIGLVASFLLSRSLSNRIRTLSQGAAAFAEGNLQTAIQMDGRDEISGLATAFNEMAARIAARGERLRESKERLRTILNAIQTGVVVLDAETHVIVHANPAAEQLIGIPEPLLVGRKCHEFLCPNQESNCPITPGMKDREVHRSEAVLLNREGKQISVLKNVTNITLDGQRHLLETFMDISEHKAAEQEKRHLELQLQHAQRMEAIGTLAGGIAHDFNNILGAIMGYTELALLDVASGGRVNANLDQVLKACNRAKDVVKQILAFSRQTETQDRPLRLGPLIKEGLKLLRASIPSTIAIRHHIAEESGTVIVDPAQIHQVLFNLCTNAAHAMQNTGGILEVSLDETNLDTATAARIPAASPGPYVRLSVRDSGEGIRPEIKNRIFDPYFTTKEKGVGTGLGLSVVHGIVESHGGAVTVHSEPGQGTTFEVYLPRSQTQALEPAEPVELPPVGTEHILFVDDEQALVEIARQMLHRLGYRVTSMTDPVEALRAFEATPEAFDLVITDQTMPHMTGERLAKSLMADRPGLPVILCSGFSEIINEDKAKAMGIRAFVMKPIVMSELAKAIRNALDSP